MRVRNRITVALCILVACACKKPVDPGPDLQIVGESARFRSNDPLPRTSPWFDGKVAFAATALAVALLLRLSEGASRGGLDRPRDDRADG